MKICSSRLTTCGVTADGETAVLELVDRSDTAVSVELPFDQAEAVAMTLPHLLTQAVRRRTGQREARYVFALGEWMIEDTKEHDCLIVTLKTTDGFEVSFGIPLEACRSLGWSLQHEANEAVEVRELAGNASAPDRIEFN
jgi:hypothetical protein